MIFWINQNRTISPENLRSILFFFILIEFYAVLILNRWFYEHFQKCGYDFDEFLSA